MSTITKLDPRHRERRAMRRQLLRNPPELPRDVLPGNWRHLEYVEILTNLDAVRRSNRHGHAKHDIFRRGALQLAELCQ